jgi:hypothetical protein
MIRKDLEDKISAKLTSLSNEDAQRVAEEYVRVLYPARFPFFAFRAFSPEGKSRSGWPDAAYVGVDGKIEGVEATHTASRSGVVDHLDDYLAKARELGADQLGGFVHISVSPKASFKPQEIKDWAGKFVEAGFNADRVELVFGQTLVNTLTRPEFARTRVEVLGIEDLPTNFSLYRSKVGPDGKRLGTGLIPSWEDLKSGRIHRPQLAETVTEALSRDRVALVRGIGASGKTVMAWLLAQDVLARGLPAYSFDFATFPDAAPDLVNVLISDLKRFAHPDVLFVVDNIHIDETSAKELYLAWEEIPHLQRPQLLLMGRETRTAKGSAIESLNLDALPLRARQPELRGVFQRLALRQYADHQVPNPPEAELSNWLDSFGDSPENPEATADLITFSAAVARRLSDLCRGRWKLTHGDAIEEVKDVYLRKLSTPERENLIRVCVAQEFEVSVPGDALSDQDAELTKCNTELGIIFRDEYGKHRQYVRYRLAHAALGGLILSAYAGDINRIELLRDMALANPLFGAVAAARMSRTGKQDDADFLVATLLKNPETLLKFNSVQNAYLFLRMADRFEVSLPQGLDASLATEKANPRRLTEIALHTPLHFLTTFLRYTQKSLPQTFTALETALADPENFPDLVDAALHSPLGALTNFLGYAEESLNEVFLRLKFHFSTEEGIEATSGLMMGATIDELVSTLRGRVLTEVFQEAFLLIKLKGWEELRGNSAPPKIDAFVAFQKIAYESDKSDLLNCIALNIVENSTRSEWDQLVLGLHHLSHVIRLAIGASTEQKRSFVLRVTTPEWLDARYATVSAGGLAGNLHSLFMFLPYEMYEHFNRDSLQQRIVSELRSADDPKARAEALSLLGAALLMNVACDTSDVVWPDATELKEVLFLRAPVPDRASIGGMDVQLWLGLRMMAAKLETPHPVSAELGDKILELWQASQAQLEGEYDTRDKVREINDKIIPWLEACRSGGWKLLPP